MAVKKAIFKKKRLKKGYLYLRRANGKRVLIALGAVFVIGISILLISVLFFQDLLQTGNIFAGITIDGQDVGGMTRDHAKEVVQQSVADPLQVPLTLTYKDESFELDLSSISMSVDVEAMVNKAYGIGRNWNIFARMFRRFANRPIERDVSVIVKYDEEEVAEFIAGIARKIDVAPKNASFTMASEKPQVTSSKTGISVNQQKTIENIAKALPTGTRSVPVTVDEVKPSYTEDDIGYIIVIKQSEYLLYLYYAGTLETTFSCAVGTDEYPTPSGKFSIQTKEENPTWYPPNSEWAKDLKPIPPGPNNPLGSYWMSIGNEIGIHSTNNANSVGYSSSHGCIRLTEWSAQYVFSRVKIGTPVYIYPKPAPPPAPTPTPAPAPENNSSGSTEAEQ